MAKTPVTILQELGAKECIIPKYTIISQDNNANVNKFTIRVEYKDNCVSGTALSKQQAKQNAAQNMLQLLQKSKDITRSPLQTSPNENNIDIEKPSSISNQINLTFINHVGSLQEYCIKYKLKNPVYELRQTSGPSHNLEFTISCTVGSITEEAAEHSKKQAKQSAARKVLENLSKTIGITINESCEQSNEETKQINEQILKDLNVTVLTNLCQDIEVKYKNAIIQNSLNNHLLMHSNKNTCPSDYHLFYKNLIYSEVCNSSSEKLILLCKTLKPYLEKISIVDKHKNNLDATRNILAYLKEQFNLSMKRVTLTSKIKEMHIIGFQVNNCVTFTQFYISNNELSAEIGALQKIIAALLLYLK